MSRIVGGWKSYHARFHAVGWQDNFFDYRIRSASDLAQKEAYIRMNPVAKGLCERPEAWPWVVESD